MIIGYGVFYKGKLCFTGNEITEGKIWQIYQTKEEAEEFTKLPFVDLEEPYEVRELNF